MFSLRNRRDHAKRRPLRPALGLEALEDRTLLSAAPPTTVLDLNGVSVNPNQYSSADILVQFQGTPGTPGGPVVVAGTTLGSQLPMATNFYEVNLGTGMTVAQALAAYKAEPGVLDAEADYKLTVSTVPNDPLLSQQWALNNTGQSAGTAGDDIKAEQAWSVTSGSPNIVVAVMDTGIDYNSPDLYQNIWINQAEAPSEWYTKSSSTSGYNTLVYKWEIKTATPNVITFRDLNNPVNKGLVWDNNGDGRIDAGDLLRSVSQGGWDSGSTKDGDTAHPDDLFGWNFVSNTNSPLDDNGHGTNVSGILGATGNNGLGVAGVDWNVQIMPVKFIGSDGDGSVSNFIQGLNYAVQHGAKISNNSWEGAPYSQALASAIQNAQQHGQIFVAAAGNEGSNNDSTPDYPASFSQSFNNVVAVAATTNTNQLASFSNYGAHSVDLAAPGVNILSTLPNGQYGNMSGTSMATPEVTGAMALVWGLHPTWTYTQVIDQVLNTTQKLSSLQGKVATGGLLDLAAAVGYSSSSTATTTGQTYSNSTATTIKAWSTTSSTISVPAGTTIGSLQVKINATYPADGELYMYLIAPNGKTDALVDNRGGTGANFTNTVFSQQGTTAISAGKAPFSGTYLPESSLSQLNGLSAGGNWRLMIVDSGGHSGTLLNWSLIVTPASTTTSTGQTYSNSTATTIKAWSTTSSTISVPAGTTIGSLQVKINATYPDDGELYMYLIAPNGKTVALVDNRGGTGANFTNTVFSQQGTTAIGAGKAPFSGTYLPESSLSQLNGLSAGGSWRLMIVDSGGHSGTLLNWSLIISPAAGSTSSVSAPSPKTYSNSTATSIKAWTTTTSTISVPAGTTIGSLQVKINATYPDDGELYMYLVAPNGKTVALIDNRGGTGANFTNTVFSDTASTLIASAKAPFSGTFRPESVLSQLNGISATGTWRLMVKDSGGHSGTLLNWSLIITPASGSTSSVQVSSVGTGVPTASSTSTSATLSSPAGTSGLPQVSGQLAGNDGISAMLSALVAAQNKDTPTPPMPVDDVFASPFVMDQMRTTLLVGKPLSNNSNDNHNG